MKPYVIATWPDGTRLIRPSKGLLWIITGNGSSSRIDNGGSSQITFSQCEARARVATYGQVPQNIRRATIWALGLLMIERHNTSSANSLRLPVVPNSDTLVSFLHEDLSLVNLEPAAYREGIWKLIIDKFLGEIQVSRPIMGPKYLPIIGPDRELAGDLSGEITWKHTLGGRMVMVIPSIRDISNGASPSWAVESISGWRLPPSSISPYDALFRANLMVTNEGYPKWLEENGSPGTMVDDMSAYTLLGLPFPPAMEPDEFACWRESMP